MSRSSVYQPAMSLMAAAQGLLALTVLSLMLDTSVAYGAESTNSTALPSSSSSLVSCLPDITDAEAYKTEHPICARLAAEHQDNTGIGCVPVFYEERLPTRPHGTSWQDWSQIYCLLTIRNDCQRSTNDSRDQRLNVLSEARRKLYDVQRARCVSVQRRPVNVTFHWDRDPSRAASALLTAILRHVLGFQRVHVAPQKMLLAEFHRPDELVISLAEVLQDAFEAATEVSDQLMAYHSSHVPTGRRLHAWLTPAARGNSACHSVDWTFYSNLTALSLCGFIDPLPNSYYVSMDAMEVFGVGDDCKATMQKLLQRAKAAGSPLRAIFVNRTDIQRELLTSKYSFLFLDYDMWAGEPGVDVVQPPPCGADSDNCQSELEYSDGMLIADLKIHDENNQLYKLVEYFNPTPESLRKILEQEANGVNLEEAACEWAQNYKTYISQEVFQSVENVSLIKPDNSKNIRNPKKNFIATYLCVAEPDNRAYDNTIRNVGRHIFTESSGSIDLSFVRFYVNCSDPDDMSRKLDGLMQGPRALNVLGVVSLAVEGAAAASEAAAAHRVPLLLARAVPAQAARGASTWRSAGQLRHVALALHNFVAQSGWTRVAVLSQPSTFARDYFAEFQDKAQFFLRNFEIPLGLTEQLAKKALQDLQATKTRVVLVNTDSEAAALILATAVKLKMSYTDGFIWILREQPRIISESGTIYFTVSLSNQVKDGMSTSQLQMLGADGERQFVPPHSVALADALMTLSTGFYNIYVQNPYLQNDLRSDKMIWAFDVSLDEEPVTGFDGAERHYKDRAVEEVNVYVDKWCGSSCKPQRLATWRVNAMSGSVRGENGSQPTLSLDFGLTYGPVSSGCGVRSDVVGGSSRADSGVSDADGGSSGANVGNGAADGGKQHVIATDKLPHTSNTAYIVHQWVESISKIETTKSNLSISDILNFPKFNHLENLNTLN